MDSSELQTPQKSRRLLWFGVGAVVLLIVVIVGLSLLMASTTQKEATANESSSPAATPVVTKDEVTQNLSTLDASIKQAQAEQDAAKAALKDSQTQVKIGN
jgi:septal ring-binding cell division protein DamX